MFVCVCTSVCVIVCERLCAHLCVYVFAHVSVCVCARTMETKTSIQIKHIANIDTKIYVIGNRKVRWKCKG